ncbi:MAG: dephospho-CoA kinase [Firmicutes bacterium]|nr:dephospho-CoA kinase [Bacillota bacterium]
MSVNNAKKTVVGLTGGIAAGKSAVADIWRGLGAHCISADEVARQITAHGSSGYKAVASAFSEALTQEGTLNRAVLREIVFSDAAKRKQLESITHPLIFAEILRQINIAAEKLVVIEAALLFESGFAHIAAITVCAVCSLESRIKRLCARDHIDENLARSMIAAQMDNTQKAALCDYTVNTDVPRGQLKTAAQELFRNFPC